MSQEFHRAGDAIPRIVTHWAIPKGTAFLVDPTVFAIDDDGRPAIYVADDEDEDVVVRRIAKIVWPE